MPDRGKEGRNCGLKRRALFSGFEAIAGVVTRPGPKRPRLLLPQKTVRMMAKAAVVVRAAPWVG
jgi:hypothetical protein